MHATIRGRTLARKPTNDTPAAGLATETGERSGKVSQEAEVSITADAARPLRERWLAENKEALETSNVFVLQQGLPLARHRNF